MANRQEEKQRRRAEREARQRAEAAAARRRRRTRIVLATLAAAALAAGIIALVALGGEEETGGPTASPETAGVKIPERRIADLDEAAKAAGCRVQHPESEGQGHTTEPVQYKTNPPTSGRHHPEPAADGVYEPGNAPDLTKLVHGLEHGRVIYQYQPGLPEDQRRQLEALYNEKGGYHQILVENTTDMPYAVAATAWNQLLSCPRMNDRVFDALRAFRDRYTDKAPEFVP